jgi:hypothetical protein
MVYGLGKRGAAVLQGESSFHYQGFDLENRNKPGRLFLEHALMISDFMIAMEKSCRARGIRLINPDEIRVAEEARARQEPFRWSVKLSKGLSCGVIPDQVFGLEFDKQSGHRRAWFFLEADRATMPVVRAALAKTSFYRKLLAYSATWRQNLHRRRFGWDRFRVLTVTSSRSRVQNLIQACGQLQHGHGLFLFTDTDSLQTQPDAFSLQWQTARPGVSSSLLN